MDVNSKQNRGNRGPELQAVARRLFFKRGYAGTSIEQIAGQAGFSKRTVYLYFKNKDDIFLSVVEEGMIILRDRLAAIDVDNLPIDRAIETFLDVYLKFATEHEPYYRMIFQEATARMVASASDEVRERLKSHEHACIGMMAKVIENAQQQGFVGGIDPWQAGVIAWAATAGILQLSTGVSQTVFTKVSRDELIRRGVRTLYNGLRWAAMCPEENEPKTKKRKEMA